MTTTLEDFEGIDGVVADDLRFRMKLGIGADAYRSLRYSRRVMELWDVGGVAMADANFAATSTTLGGFFGGSGIMATLGVATAATPVGWTIAAGLVTASAYFGVTRLAGSYAGTRVVSVPVFINTPVDILGVTLVDMIGTLAVKMSEIDGHADERELQVIKDYFVEEWGIDARYASRAINLIAENDAKISLRESATALGAFVRDAEDCNAEVMRKDLMALLHEIALADGKLDEREELALEKIDEILRTEINMSISRTLNFVGKGVSEGAGTAAGQVAKGAEAVAQGLGTGARNVSTRAGSLLYSARKATAQVSDATERLSRGVAGRLGSGLGSALSRRLKLKGTQEE
ncbi:Tellurite resistance protein TerB [Aquimixticola soesokkakensis]|uniref:Tellurite resistance protein TerB n=1 Tax=Aquimixticola soesokkakensis TaxID=1519096 RepID=A0A1Y5SJ55_9RHOB|nr:TerB family tellurite resistance protein [Aquimixticola soesokkakensis]SLN41675.1 Tellurite resistance protein TerB [Aquimixticola soesokkakensis]